MKSIFLVLTSSYLASCLPPPHPAVVAVRREEESLPPHLRSRALWNPHLQEVLPLTSLLHEGENPVFEREADNVSRQEIYNILTHAGFLRRRPFHQQPDPHHQHHQRVKSGHKHAYHQAAPYQGHFNGHFQRPFHSHQQLSGHLSQGFFDPYLGNPDFLQYL